MPGHCHGGDIYTKEYRMDFSANLNPLGMPKGAQIAARRGVALSDRYPDVRCGELKRALSEKEGVPEEQIICGNGAAELIYVLAQAVQPKRALLTSPGFAEYEQALPEGCRVSFYPLKEERGFALEEDYLDALTEDVDLAFLCSPHNPTGALIKRERLLSVIERCEQRKIRLVLDLCFMDFLQDPKQMEFCALLPKYPHLFLLKAFTKTYAMAGLRLGYGLSADARLLEQMEGKRQPWSVSVPAQLAGAAALQETRYVQEARQLVEREREYLSRQLQGLGFTVFPAAANFLFFKGPEDLASRCAEKGILIRDCSNYRGLKKGYFRVAVRTHVENRELVRVLYECIR